MTRPVHRRHPPDRTSGRRPQSLPEAGAPQADPAEGLPAWPHADEFAALDEGLPLLLLPVGIQTRYVLDADPPQLRIRILPDPVHVDAGPLIASPTEHGFTTDFWRAWNDEPDDDARSRSWRRYVRQVGTRRAGYLARTLRPRTDARGGLTFPAVSSTQPPGPATAALLPEKWTAIAYAADGTVLFQRDSRPIAAPLRVAADPDATGITLPDSGLRVDDGIAWMFSYERAVEAGMAITVPLVGAAAAATDIATLLVIGLTGGGADDLARRLDMLLAAHARTDGLAFLPQGTPTNAADSGTTGTAESAHSFRRGARVATGPVTDATVLDVPPIFDPGPSRPGSNAERLAQALGLADASTLDRAPLGDDHEFARSRAMRRVLYHAVYGIYTEKLLSVGQAQALTPAARTALRDWYARHLTGGAPYPAVRVGSQPYGVLPVCRSVDVADAASTTDHIRHILSLAVATWQDAAATLPRLDPGTTDVAGGADPGSDVAAVLATAPHPARFFLRRLDEYAELDAFTKMVTPQFWYETFVLGGLDLTAHPDKESPLREVAMAYGDIAGSHPIETIDDQIEIWDQVYAELPNYTGGPDSDMTRDGRHFIDTVRGLLNPYEARQRPLRWLDLSAYEGVVGEQNTAVVEALLHAVADEWPQYALVEDPDAAAGQTAAEYLRDLRERLASATDTVDPGELDRQPLLYQLIDRALPSVAAETAELRSEYLADLDLLAALEPAELTWLMRETLGLGTHRLDAWATSLATEKLDRLRRTRPTGVQVGAYGWVTDLRPRATGPTSQGYIHAPSLAHATTAALLRTGWLAHGDPVAVDAASPRVRAANWLFDGVRAGADLGELLGYQFERSLHDLGAQEWISPVRRAVLDAAGRTSAQPDQPVDGVDLLDLARSAGLDIADGRVTTALADLADAFDATGDLGLLEAVHQLAAGNLERAGAMLDALTGLTAPPELRAARTPRAGVAVEHRVVILLDPDAPAPGRGWSAGLRSQIAPALEAWIATLLPPAGDIGFRVTVGGVDRAMAVSQLGLSALDAVYLVGDDPMTAPAWSVLAGGSAATIDATDRGDHPVCLREFEVLARELRRAIEPLRVADARDMRPAADPGEPDTDGTAARAAVQSLVDGFAGLVDRLAAVISLGGDPAEPLAELARYGVAAGAPEASLADAEHRMSLVAAVDGTAADADKQRIAALLRATVPMLATFPLSGGAVDVTGTVAGPAEVGAWLDQIALVRPRVGRLVTAGMLATLLADGGLHARAGQTPLFDGDGWAATSAPAPRTGGRLSIVALTAEPPAPGASACGLVVDAWSERVPSAEQTTGLAVHFDAPSNRPPQAWLLATVPDGQRWNRQLVVDTLTETLEWAALRAVGPEDLLEYGRALPTTYMTGYVLPWPAENPPAEAES